MPTESPSFPSRAPRLTPVAIENTLSYVFRPQPEYEANLKLQIAFLNRIRKADPQHRTVERALFNDSRGVHHRLQMLLAVMTRQIERDFLALVVLLALAALPARAAEPVSVLVLEQEDPGRPGYLTFMSGFRQQLVSRISGRVNVYSENLDLSRFDTPACQTDLEGWLRTKYTGRKLAAVTVAGTRSLDLIFKMRASLWPEVPIIFTAIPPANAVQFRPPSIWEAQRGVVIAVAAALLAQSGLIVALLAQLRRRRLAEKSLRESEERQSLAAESAKVGFWSLDKSSGCCWTPPPTLELWGLDSGITLDLEGFLNVVHPEDRGVMRQTIERALDVAQQKRVEFRVVLPNGSVRWFVSLGRSQVNSKGEITGLTGVSLDITGRKLAEEALHREKALTDAVFDSVPGLLYLYAEDGRMMRWNKKHEELTGYSALELANMSIVDWFSEDDFASVTPEWESVFNKGHTIMEVNLKLKNGTKVPYLATGVRLEIDGKPHMVGIAIDITEQKRLEMESKRHFLELAHVSRVVVMGELTASLAHELNQPLGAILRNAEAAEILLDGDGDQPDLEEVRAILADIRKDAHRAGDVIDRLRGLLKRRNLQSKSLEVGALIGDTVSLVRPDAVARHASVSADVPPGLPQVIGDRVQLQQVLLNLLLNGIDAVEGQPDVKRRIMVVAQRTDAAMLEVSVHDSGRGIAPADISKLFDSFFTSKPHGLGMGLSISRTIIQAHGGRIRAENNPDGGATFSFTLPIAAASKAL